MTALILTEAGLDPTVLIGGELNVFNGNHRSGKSSICLVEACEFKRSFLKLRPSIELITNIDWDHPDCFPTMDEVIKTFADFVDLLPANGTLFTWGDDLHLINIRKRFTGKKISFGYNPDCDWSVVGVKPLPPLGISAQILYQGKNQGEIRLKVPGSHNLLNAIGAIAIATEMGVPLARSLNTISEFSGVQHRFELKGNYNGALVVDDYGHHPGAIRTTLAAARQFFKGRIWCAFQPHLFSRTKYLLEEFAHSFSDADILVLADIYPAREIDPGDISSLHLYNETQKYHHDVRYLGDFNRIYEHLSQNLKTGDLLITMGAGDIWKVGERLVREQ